MQRTPKRCTPKGRTGVAQLREELHEQLPQHGQDVRRVAPRQASHGPHPDLYILHFFTNVIPRMEHLLSTVTTCINLTGVTVICQHI